MRIKQLIKICIGRMIARMCGYDPEYLTGRWFEKENNYVGWDWVIRDARTCRAGGVNLGTPWPVSARECVVGARNIDFHPDDLNNFQHFGCYFQGKGKIHIGKGTYIAPNVGIITANHNIDDLDTHLEPKAVYIGERCWIGMNSMILPGVTLGDNTVVGAGAVVTKSFEEGNVVIAGNPARIIKKIGE